ncbi:MAG TPA: hypothetical protein VND19_12205 [Acetobacteraceae bacterium]|nr:hypothetical protein [Acetobacteraceae bacterium]
MSALGDRIIPIQAGMLSDLNAQVTTASQQINVTKTGPEWDPELPHEVEAGGFTVAFGITGLQTDVSSQEMMATEIGNHSVGVQPSRGIGWKQTPPASLSGSGTFYETVGQQRIAEGSSLRTGMPAGEFKGTIIGPVRALLAVFQRWDIPDVLAARVLGADGPEYIANLRSGASTLKTRDEQDRARLLIDIYEGAFSLLQDPGSEKSWIKMPRADFSGQSVLELLTEGSQRNLIRAQAFVDYANGR